MVSSVKEVNVKGVKLVRRAFVKAAAGKKVLNQHEALLSLPGRLGEVI
jgi:hypothetical protein